MRLAQEHDQVCLRQNLGEGTQTRVVDAARTFHRQHRNTEHGLQFGKRCEMAGMTKLWSGEDQRTRGGTEQVANLPRVIGAKMQHARRQSVRTRVQFGAVLDVLFQEIERHTQMHRSRPARHCNRTGLGKIGAQLDARLHGPRSLGDRLGHVGLAQLLEGAAADFLDAGVP